MVNNNGDELDGTTYYVTGFESQLGFRVQA